MRRDGRMNMSNSLQMLLNGLAREAVNYAVGGAVLLVIILAVIGACTVVKAVAAR